MDTEELLKRLLDEKDAHISDLQQTVGLQIALSNRLLNALIPPDRQVPMPKPDDQGGDA